MEQNRPQFSEFLIFRIQEQEFCLEVSAVREIRSATKTVPLPNAPIEFKGLINLRGVVLPVVDLAQRLGLAMIERPTHPVVIVAESGARIAGLEVDVVDDIISVSEDDIQPIPTAHSGGVHDFVRGVVNISGRLICILVMDRLLPAQNAGAA